MHPSKQPRRILSISVIVTFILVVIMVYQASKIFLMDGAEAQSKANGEQTKVSILTSDKIVDQSWGSLAYTGQMKIEENFPVDTRLYSELKNPKDKENAVKLALDEGSQLIIGHGREFSDVFNRFAENEPESTFVTIHGSSKHSNQAVYTFDQGEIEYFAALAAGMKTKTNKIGVIDSIDEHYNPQFEKGISYYKPEAELYYYEAGSRDDGNEAVEVMDQLLEKDVDVIYSKGNAFNQNVIEHAKKHGVFVIGYVEDQSYMAKDLVLTSVINDVPQVYMVIMRDYFSVEGIQPGVNILDEGDEIFKLAPFGPMFSEQELNYIDMQKTKFYSGEIRF
ncbi:BMP family ABC transporter substrate-binding protein [Salipaludibacillus neizhouensis]|uniref:BMP family ABC transporter substrate-binding protein n=1 Tax=Salipaludibacillus neizhouensis TaxID=885475 RepID=A0A3A9KF84_9BACI|nr:BMP family ABC transporter substrate-binding protein [Salipaludibacillus neizhouensis]RKL68283.1 BMP family ABC transporter substrate-binding protein [Salipaludibacillus neizhouensis]